jgi:TM2 domain-containing membrane protein YozV
MIKMFCSNCGQGNVDGSKFCFKCGKALQAMNDSVQLQAYSAQNVMQPQTYSSQYVMPPQAYHPQYVTPASDKSKQTAILLCCLGFVCVAGLHRLYVGKIFSGICYLMTCGFLWFGTIADLIQLLLGQFPDNVGQPLRQG